MLLIAFLLFFLLPNLLKENDYHSIATILLICNKTRMTTSIISEAQKKSWIRKQKTRFKMNLLKSGIMKPFSRFFLYFLVFFGITDIPTKKVNYILDAHWNRESLQ